MALLWYNFGMEQAVTFTLSVSLSFLGHHLGERLLQVYRKKSPRLVVRGYRVHHSFFGILAVVIGLVFAGSYTMLATLGYGLGTIWQHRWAHNQAKEKGMVFITKVQS
ncbi:MAG: hypothetical protein UY65_C0005G0017 [Parcubacteria group bacterium GW2011_GWA2_51_12]|nr:MAG: hypothetical protein UY65_C0005G0017 [Parcubacteria group bacterium GW2011_GWA2_51_12]